MQYQGNTNEWTYTFNDLPKYNKNGDEIEYTIDEEGTNSEFYQKTDVNQETRTITNTFKVPEETVTVKVTKNWVDFNNEAQKRPTNVTVQVKNGKQVVKTEPLSEGNNWTAEIEVPKYDSLGREINYTVDEEELGNKFYQKTGITGDMTGGYTITNTFEVPDETVSVPVTKVWNDNNNKAGKRPESVTLKLTGNGQEYTHELTKEENPENANNWTYTFTRLPKYNRLGNEITYAISEEEITGTEGIFYTEENTEISGNMTEGYTVTNTFEVPDEKVSVNVTKTWEDTEEQKDKRPEKVTIVLSGNGTEQRKEIETKENTTVTFDNLPKYDSNGDEITYTTTEEGNNKFYMIESTTGNMQEGYTITNKFQRPEETTEITVNKIWKDNNEQANRRPGSIIIVVKNGDQEVASKKVTSNDIVEGTTNQWTVTIGNLAKYDDNGNEIKYTIDEKEDSEDTVGMKFYEKTGVTEVKDGQASITNTYKTPSDTVSVKVTKAWEDTEEQKDKRPEQLTIILNATNGEVAEQRKEIATRNAEGEIVEDTTEVTFDNSAKIRCTMENEIAYTVAEEGNNKFYTVEDTTGNMQEGYTITNKFVKPEETTEITVNKIWKDNSEQASRRPGSIIIVVKNGDQEVASKKVTSNDIVEGTTNQWTVTIDNLPKYDDNGNEIKYTVDEKEDPEDTVGMKFYEKTGVTEVKDGQASITNTYKTPSDTVSVNVTKAGKIQKTKR